MKIAVIGAGLSGLALAWHYKSLSKEIELTLFDPEVVDERTSALAHLLYPYVGIKSKLNPNGKLALEKSTELLNIASRFSTSPIYKKTSLLKLGTFQRQIKDLKKAANNYDNLSWREKTSFNMGGLWLDEIIQVDAQRYLEALEKAVSSLGVHIQKARFTQEMEKDFDQIIYCTGHHAKDLSKEPLSRMKGQGLILKRPDSFEQNYCLIAHQLHMIPSIDKKTLYVGNTFEKEFECAKPNLEKAISLLWPKLIQFYPDFTQDLIIGVKAGVRLNASTRLPVISKVNEKVWHYGALGSKGLLYHSFYAEKLARALKENSNEEMMLEP